MLIGPDGEKVDLTYLSNIISSLFECLV